MPDKIDPRNMTHRELSVELERLQGEYDRQSVKLSAEMVMGQKLARCIKEVKDAATRIETRYLNGYDASVVDDDYAAASAEAGWIVKECKKFT